MEPKIQEGEEENTVLGLGQMKAGQAAGGPNRVLLCLGLGSCVALSAYDPVSRVGGMAHMVLPHSQEGGPRATGAKFVDCGIPMLFDEMEALGAARSRMVVKLVGGAQMIASANGDNVFKIGERNVESAKAVLAQLGVRPKGTDIGGDRGRTVRLYLDSGRVVVSRVGGPSHDL